jgi:hypothetical protein
VREGVRHDIRGAISVAHQNQCATESIISVAHQNQCATETLTSVAHTVLCAIEITTPIFGSGRMWDPLFLWRMV